MRPVSNTATTLIASLLLLSTTVLPCEASPRLDPLVEGNSAFAVDLYSELAADHDNLFFSPLSISTALAMTYGGARGNTEHEMARTLHFALGQEETHRVFSELQDELEEVNRAAGVQLHTADSIWPQRDHPLLEDYVDLLRTGYGVSLTPVDFIGATEEARTLINTWVEEQTEDRIQELIARGQIDPATVLVLVNAVYFKGSWASRFDPELTSTQAFTRLDQTTVEVPMMRQRGRFRYREVEGTQVLELPHQGDRLSMFVVLPDEPGDLADVEEALSEGGVDAMLAGLNLDHVDVQLPRFKLTWGTFDLAETLISLGMRDAFAAGRADFSAMDGTRELFIGMVLHKAFLEVTEEGSEAAAATAVVMKRGPGVPRFCADHPFVVIIRDNQTGSILFMGRVADPSSRAAS